MLRRTLFKSLLGAAALVPGLSVAAKVAARPRSLLIQESPLAGFQYYQGQRVWPRLTVGQPLDLRREPDNPFDARAVAVWWHGRQLGYLPRNENTAVAQMLDRGERLEGRIAALSEQGGPWRRIRLSVHHLH